MTIGVKVTGLREVQRALRALPDHIERPAVLGAMERTAEPMRQAAIDAAPLGPKAPHLRDAIITSDTLADTQKSNSTADRPYVVVAHVGAKNEGGGQVAHLNEFGTGPRFHESGKYVGEMPAQPFMRPAYDAHKRSYISRFGPTLWEIVRKAVKRVKV